MESLNSEELHRRLAEADPAEQPRIITEALEHANQTHFADDYMTVAMACVSLGRYKLAAQIFRRVVVGAGDHAMNAVYRLSLASAFEDLEWFACSRCLREYVVASAPTEEYRDIARAELARLRTLLDRRIGQVAEGAKIETESPGLASIVAQFSSGGSPELSPETEGAVHDLFELLRAEQESLGPDPDKMRMAALEDLTELARRYPRSVSIAMSLAWALLWSGRGEQLRQHLPHLATLEQPNHTFHYNYGQLLLFGNGDVEGARRHLRLALTLAKTAEDVSDAKEKITELRPLIGDLDAT
jgi:hypothetical protein